MRFFEVDSAVDAIMSAALLAQGRASEQNKQGKLSMTGFLQMLANSDVVIDYDGFKNIFDRTPALQNVIAQFNKDTITFKGDSDDEDAGFEAPSGEMPDDERVSNMAKRAMKTREFIEDKLPPHLAKMFGKDGRQVDTRTDVMKQMRDIVANKQAMKVKFGDGDQMIDMYTASVLTQIYDKVNDNSKEAIIQRIGTKEKFAKLMPKLFGMLGEGHSPHKKGTKKYKAHMAAMHAGESVNEGMEDKIKKDIIAGMSTDAIIGKYANKRTTNTDEIRKIIQKIKWNMRKNNESVDEGIRKGKPATGKDRIPDPAMISLKKRIAKHVEDGLTKRDVVAAYPDYDPNDIARLYDNEKALQDFEADAKARFGNIERKPSKKLSLTTQERSLTKAEKGKMRSYEKKIDKADFIERYGKKEGPGIYYGTITKMAKKNA